MSPTSKFAVTVRMPGQLPCDALPFAANAVDAASVIIDMIDRFGPCMVTVKPFKAAQ